MRILLDQTVNSSAEGASPRSGRASASPAPARPATPSLTEEIAKRGQESAAPAGILQANVTFRRDAAGQIYYVVTDAQSGKEIRELPPQAVRKVSEGIAEYLKQEEAKAHPHLEVKA
jgi:uncharacterized FlaG/YvyC family protein